LWSRKKGRKTVVVVVVGDGGECQCCMCGVSVGIIVESCQPAGGEGEPVLDVRHSVGAQVQRRGRKPRRQGSNSLLAQHQGDVVRRD